MRTIAVLLLFCLFAINVHAADDGYFSSSSENGITGILDSPTARFMPENTFRIGYSKASPYINYIGAVSLYDRFELAGKIGEIEVTEWSNRDSEYWSGYGNYKDKFLAVKYKLLKESKFLPQVAIGLNDPHGTKLFGAQYVAVSKQIYPFDFTVGAGLGRYGDVDFAEYGKRDILNNFLNPHEFYENGNLFYSIQFRPSDKFSFLYELSPIEYDKHPREPAVRYGAIKDYSRHNFGFRYYLSKNLYFTASYQRGDTFGFGVTMPFRIGEPVIPIYTPPPVFSEKFRKVEPELGYKLAMQYNAYSPAGAVVIDGTAYIEIANNRFFFEEDSMLYTFKIMSNFDFEGVDEVVVIVKDKNIPLYTYSISTDVIDLYREGKITEEQMMEHASVSRKYLSVDIANRSGSTSYYYGVKPQFNFYLNDPSGFFKGSMGVKGWAGKYIYENLSVVGGAAFYPINTVSTNNEPLSIPVRSDIPEYIDKKYRLENLELDYISRIKNTDLYFNAEAGILEIQYAGLNADIGTHILKDKLLVALSGHIVKKRDKDNELVLDKESDTYKTCFVKTRINSKRLGGYLEVHAGRFLAGDKGAKFVLTKNIKGVLLTAWYTKTDTSIFSDSENRGYSDKGISVSVPFRLFTGKDTKSNFGQSISPWTRDVGVQVGEFTNILDFIGKSPYELR